MTIKEKVEGLLFIDNLPTVKQSKLIDMIISLTEAKLLGKLPKGTQDVPATLEYIVVEVSVKRFNRVGSEGMTTEEVEGHRMDFGQNDFAEFEEDIAKWIDDQEDTSRKVLRFL